MKDSNKKSYGIGLTYALSGLKEVFLYERNFRIQIFIAIIVLIIGWFVRLSSVEWLILLITIQFVLVTEMINSIIERLIDYLKPEIHPKAKVIKDLAAGVVLFAAIISIIVGLVIFLPKLLRLIQLA